MRKEFLMDAVVELSVELRREMFSALVAAQDEKMGVKESREVIANRFGVDVSTVREVEDEGLDNAWPPFGKG